MARLGQWVRIGLAFAALSVFAVTAQAYMQPSVNLGFTSFLDGGPPAGPGLYVAEYIQYYMADDLKDLAGPGGGDGGGDGEGDGDGGGSSPDVDAWISLTQVIYQSNKDVFLGGKAGLDVIVPVVRATSSGLPDNGAGVGDLLIGPYVQWDPVMGDNGPVFMHRIEFQTIFPTGKYDSSKALNPGSNVYAFNPYWAGTVFLGPKVTASCRLHWLYSGKNPDMANAQAGQAFHANFAADYEVKPKQLRVGVNGYYFKQFTDSEVGGSVVPDKEQVLGIGPGALWSFSQDTHLFANVYFETAAEYRPQGQRFNVRLVHHF